MNRPDSGDSEIHFKPINEGLGFHPFSNGLPYAPVSKKPAPVSGPNAPSGAVTAGAPRFVRPTMPPPMPQNTPLSPPRLNSPVAVPARPASAPIPPESVMLAAEPHYGFAYLLKRVSAYALDCCLNLCVVTLITAVSIWLTGSADAANAITGDLFMVAFLLFLMLNWVLVTLQEMVFKTTAGKKLFGLSFIGARPGSILIRAIAFPVSLVFFGLGLIWAVFDSRRRCWHDIASRVQPIELAKL